MSAVTPKQVVTDDMMSGVRTNVEGADGDGAVRMRRYNHGIRWSTMFQGGNVQPMFPFKRCQLQK